MTVVKELIVHNKVGLHARPAAFFVKTANTFKSSVTVENLSRRTRSVNGKSLLSILSIAVQKDDRIKITIEGDDEQLAIDAFTDLIANNFGEE